MPWARRKSSCSWPRSSSWRTGCTGRPSETASPPSKTTNQVFGATLNADFSTRPSQSWVRWRSRCSRGSTPSWGPRPAWNSGEGRVRQRTVCQPRQQAGAHLHQVWCGKFLSINLWNTAQGTGWAMFTFLNGAMFFTIWCFPILKDAIFSVTRRSRSDVSESLSESAIALTWLMWLWWVRIPTRDLTDEEDEEDDKSYQVMKVIKWWK